MAPSGDEALCDGIPDPDSDPSASLAGGGPNPMQFGGGSGAFFVVPSDIGATLASLPGILPSRARPSRARRAQPRPPRLSTGGGAGGAASRDSRRGKRRRVPGVRDAADDLSAFLVPPAESEDVYAESSSGNDAAGTDLDALGTGDRAEELTNYYKQRITRVLSVALGDAPHVDENAGMLFRVVSVQGGAAVVLSEGERAYAVRAQNEDGRASYLCTCDGMGGGESAEVRSWLGTSSSCCHARGLQASYAELANASGLADDVALLTAYAVLDNASVAPQAECDVSFATTTATKKAVFAVRFQSTWAAVVVRNKLNKQRNKKRVQRRPACALMSCAKNHWTCPHASSVAQWCAHLQQATAAVEATIPGFADPFKHVLLPTVVQAARVTAAAQAAEWAAFSDEARGRCSRNLLPCVGEVADCSLFDQLADIGRAAGHPAYLPDVLCEARCFSCGSDYNGAGVKHTAATLHTLRGRVAVTLRRWTSGCGKPVPYDGAHEGLFASSSNTVFTRTYLDVMTQMVFTGHGTLSSAASVLCFLLESTRSMSGAASGLARQTLIIAAHRFSRTLIVPASLFRCSKCKQAGDRPYLAVIADGQVLSILRNQSQPLVRLTEDVVGVPLDAGHGWCLASAGLRAAIRKRTTAERQHAVRLTKEEHLTLKSLADELTSEPPPHAAGASSPRARTWRGRRPSSISRSTPTRCPTPTLGPTRPRTGPPPPMRRELTALMLPLTEVPALAVAVHPPVRATAGGRVSLPRQRTRHTL